MVGAPIIENNCFYNNISAVSGHVDLLGISIPYGTGIITTTNANGDSCDQFFNIFLDPQVTSAGNFQLLEESPCIDAGNPNSPLDPDETVADMGALPYFQPDGLIEPENLMTPTEFAFLEAYPNPFNPTTSIRYQLRIAGFASLTVFDTFGRKVAVIVDGWRASGYHEVTFDATGLTTGMYIAKLTTDGESVTQKLILMK